MQTESTMLKFSKTLPKVELHAHINGSISENTIQKLILRKKEKDPEWETGCVHLKKGESGDYENCFSMFKLIYQLSDDEEAAYLITCDVISEFAEDNVKYLELRTTPRPNQVTGMTKRSYVEAVLRAIKDTTCQHQDIIVHLLFSVDRRGSVEEAEDTVELAKEYIQKSEGTVVGVDLCGMPLVGDARDFIPAFQSAKRDNLKVTMHLSEAPNQNEETEAVLEEVVPHRVGHGLFLHPDQGGTQSLIQLMTAHNIPIELCLTSNIKAQAVDSYDNHHFKYWYHKGHPCVICTDDKGVFATSLSEEYAIAAQTFSLSKEQLWDISYKSIDYIFADKETKELLKTKWLSIKEKLI